MRRGALLLCLFDVNRIQESYFIAFVYFYGIKTSDLLQKDEVYIHLDNRRGRAFYPSPWAVPPSAISLLLLGGPLRLEETENLVHSVSRDRLEQLLLLVMLLLLLLLLDYRAEAGARASPLRTAARAAAATVSLLQQICCSSSLF